MLCASCGYDNPEDATFCGECGSSLRQELACTNCGRNNPPETKFCHGCGQRLAEAPAPKPTPTPTAPTSFAAGRYQVKRFLGEGGKKRVYLAHDTRLDRDVAFSLIKTEGLDAAGLARVRREAQAMGRLGDHPNVVTVYDIGEEAGQPYIVSQFMEGGSVEDLIDQAPDHRLPIDQSLQIASEICQALRHAHDRGIIHRDVKPGNIWLSREGHAKLGDFGLAVALDLSRMTQAGMMVGTVAYMPPEQALGREPDARSDLYSLGAMLYEMVTGRPPFLGDDVVAIISQHINTAAVAPSWHNPEVPRALEALILRLLAKAPEDRPESAAAVRQALTAIASTASTVAERVVQEEANPLDRLAGGVFVGREKEMDELRAGLEDALSGRGRLLMLVGEPGIGKTRTAEELCTYASLRNTQVLWGRCYEGEGAPAYWPWVQVIRSYVHDRDSQALMSEMGPGAADIGQVVSEVRERLPGLPAPPALEPEQARFRLFDSITTFLKNAGNRQPIVLVLDDLHWADKPSLLLLQFLARELRGARLMVLGNYRDVELRREHPLADTLGELTREQLSERILLRGLTERDVARFIELTAGRKPPEALVDAVYKETEGNPFFVNEIVRLLVADGRLERPEEVKSWSVTIPQGVREVVGRRLNHLSKECNQVLTVASVIGREFGLDALDRVSDVKGDRLLEVLDEAVAARVLNEVPRAVGRYSFSHALMRETLHEELTTTRRVRLHRQIGEVLETIHSDNLEPHLPELAYHFVEAAPGGDVGKAIEYATRAAERAAALLAYEEAARHYEMALQVLETRDKPNEAQRCDLLLALVDVLWSAGDEDRAKNTSLRAVSSARTLKDAVRLGRAALGVGGPVEAEVGAADESVVSLLEEALDALGKEDSAVRARVLARLAEELSITDAERARSLSQQSIEMARRVGDRTALAGALWTSQYYLRARPESVDDRLAAVTEIVSLLEKAQDQSMVAPAHVLRLGALLDIGDIPGVDAEIEAFAKISDETRHPFRFWLPPAYRAMRALMDGRFAEGQRLSQQALAAGQQVRSHYAVQIFAVQMSTLRSLEAGYTEADVVTTKGFAEQYPAVPAWRCGLAHICSELGCEAEAREAFESLAASDFADLPRDQFWLTAVGSLSEACAFLGDERRAAKLYDLLLPYSWLNVTAGEIACYGSASRYLGLLATTMSRWEDAKRHFHDALEMHTKMGARPWLACTQHDYAKMLLARDQPGDREKAMELLGQALDTAQELGMKSLIEKALALKLRAQGIDPSETRTSIYAVASAVYVEKPDLRQHAAPDGTVTILFTDIEGSTEMTERLGDRRWLELLRAHNAIVREQVQAHGGFEVKSQGDGFMLAFGSARRAVQCAIDTQRAFAKRNESAEEPTHVRIGLHTGEAIKEAEDFYGRHVILASRVADQAEGGQILVSSLLKELTESAGDIRFGDGREVKLKGLKGKHQVFGVAWE